MKILDDMALFVEVAKVMSFRQAAEATGVPNSTLSRRISSLEKAIGLRLLHRTTRKIELTEAGQLYYQRCRRIVEEANIAHEQLREMLAQPSGVLRASLPVDFATTFIAPLLPEFSRRYPEITFDFDLTPRNADMISESIDVAIRIGEQQNSTLIARRLASLSGFLYASPQYLERFGKPQKPTDLENHECLHMSASGQWELHNRSEKIEVTVGSKFSINSVGMIKKLAMFDMGIILIPKEIVSEELISNRLIRILPEWKGTSIAVYAITETRLLPAKTKCFIEYLKEYLEQ